MNAKQRILLLAQGRTLTDGFNMFIMDDAGEVLVNGEPFFWGDVIELLQMDSVVEVQ